jgi:hypothetical protein
MIDGRQIDLFVAGAPRRPRADLDLEAALANARRFLATGSHPGDSRANQAHLPGLPGGPEIYALCPGCSVHPDGGIFPAAELARVEGCPAGPRLAAQLAAARALTGGEGRQWAEREGSARRVSAERNALSRSFSPAVHSTRPRGRVSIDFSLTTLGGLCSGALEALAAPGRHILAAASRQLRRRWYFHRRRAICRQRLSRIASDPSWTS